MNKKDCYWIYRVAVNLVLDKKGQYCKLKYSRIMYNNKTCEK